MTDTRLLRDDIVRLRGREGLTRDKFGRAKHLLEALGLSDVDESYERFKALLHELGDGRNAQALRSAMGQGAAAGETLDNRRATLGVPVTVRGYEDRAISELVSLIQRRGRTTSVPLAGCVDAPINWSGGLWQLGTISVVVHVNGEGSASAVFMACRFGTATAETFRADLRDEGGRPGRLELRIPQVRELEYEFFFDEPVRSMFVSRGDELVSGTGKTAEAPVLVGSCWCRGRLSRPAEADPFVIFEWIMPENGFDPEDEAQERLSALLKRRYQELGNTLDSETAQIIDSLSSWRISDLM